MQIQRAIFPSVGYGRLGRRIMLSRKNSYFFFKSIFLVLQYISCVAKLQNASKTSNDGRLGSFLQIAKLSADNLLQ